MKHAVLVRTLDGFRGDAKLFKLSEPISGWNDDEKYEYVVVSAAEVFGEPETYIFPADESGRVLKWGELRGSFKGAMDHGEALENAGYTIEVPS